MTISTWVKQAGGVSLAARRLNVSRQRLHNWLRGKNKPNGPLLVKLLKLEPTLTFPKRGRTK